jgi:hypothetical protein
MPQFIFVYLGGEHPSDPEEGQKHFARYNDWLKNLGDAVVAAAIPFKDTYVVMPDGKAEPGTTTQMSGLSIFQFPSMQQALAAAQECPFLEIKGTLEVSEMLEMPKAN